MSHPAINQFSAEHESGVAKWKHTYGVTDSYNVNQLRQLMYRQEPESRSNPVRPDGSRAPSDYWIKRTFLAQRSSRVETAPVPWGWYRSPLSANDNWTECPVTSGGAAVHAWLHDNSLDRGRVDQLARTSFLNKLAERSGKDEWQIGETLGEIRETSGMVADLAGGLVAGVTRVAKVARLPPRVVADVLSVYGQYGRKAALKQLGGSNSRVLEHIVEGWLVTQFGLKPLFEDCVSAAIVLGAKITDPVKDLTHVQTTVRGGAEETFRRTLLTAMSGVNGNYGYDCFLDIVEVIKVQFACTYRVPIRATWPQRLGLYNAPLVAWNLTRFSWMADYVTNVSPWLRSLMAGQDTRFVEGTRSMLCRITPERQYAKAYPGVTIVHDPMSNVLLSSDWFTREVLSHGVMPTFLPSLKARLNLDRVANATAALTAFIGARSRPGPPVINY